MKKHTPRSIESLETRQLLAVDFGTLLRGAAFDTYSVDGTGNNLDNPEWGSAGSQLLRTAPADYSDGLSAPSGEDRPGPREISNAIVDSEGEDILSDRFLSAMIYAWGQFIDHDLDLTPNADPKEPFNIPIPTGDPQFDPDETGTQAIPLNRSEFDPDTGTTTPREQINVVTSWLDGSQIYGSDETTASALRTHEGGKLKTSTGNMLPYNNEDYFPDGTVNMDNNAHVVPDDELYATGDVRGNENVELTSLHTLFVREHNYWADRIARANGSLTDDQIFERARAVVIAEIQSITYNEWLPSLLGRKALDRYDGYDPTVDGTIANEFSTAVFRLGHSLLGDDIEFLDNNGEELAEEIPLSEAFFNPAVVGEQGIGPILKYLASDPSSELDNKIVESVRNFLFGPPGAGGLDLASLNVQRGRDHGLADYNSVREAYGLERVTSFDQITSDRELAAKLESLYGSVDNIDLWPGALAEDHVAGSSVGPTIRAVVSDQFERLRDGDRFFYENAFSGRLLAQIESTGLSDIIARNTEITNLQDNAFFFRAGISGTVFADADKDGRLDRRENSLAGKTVQLLDAESGEVLATTTTDRRGRYAFTVANEVRVGMYQVEVLLPSDSNYRSPTSRTIDITRGGDFVTANLPVIKVGHGWSRGQLASARSAAAADVTTLDDAVDAVAQAIASGSTKTNEAAIDSALAESPSFAKWQLARRSRR